MLNVVSKGRDVLPIKRSGRYYAGLFLWLLSVQYYVTQVVVATGWSNKNPFSWVQNTISDLGNTACGPYGVRLVCSPGHAYMNVSFVLLGSCMFFGSLLLRNQIAAGRSANVGFVCMAFAGIGTVLVGLFPENTSSGLHILGASLPFVLGNLAMVLIGLSAKLLPRWVRIVTITSGVVGLIALGFYLLHQYLGLGNGGMERVVAYPQTIWMILVSAYFISSSVRRQKREAKNSSNVTPHSL